MIGSVDSFERKLDEAQRELVLNTSSHLHSQHTKQFLRPLSPHFRPCRHPFSVVLTTFYRCH
jgi:hypothetical protein